MGRLCPAVAKEGLLQVQAAQFGQVHTVFHNGIVEISRQLLYKAQFSS